MPFSPSLARRLPAADPPGCDASCTRDRREKEFSGCLAADHEIDRGPGGPGSDSNRLLDLPSSSAANSTSLSVRGGESRDQRLHTVSTISPRFRTAAL